MRHGRAKRKKQVFYNYLTILNTNSVRKASLPFRVSSIFTFRSSGKNWNTKGERQSERINGRLLSLMLQNVCIFFFAFSKDKRLIGIEFIALPLLCLLRLLSGDGVSNNNS